MLRILEPETVHRHGVVPAALALTGLIVASTLTANMILQFLFFAGWSIFFRATAFTLVISLAVVGPVVYVFCKLYRALYLAKLDVERLSRRDTLTGIANRLVLMERLASVRGDAVLVIADIDHFKRVNDRHGHPGGDVVLVHVARRLDDRLGAVGCVARIGGEEFAVLVEGMALDRVADLVETARQDIETSGIDLPDGTVSVTISAGIAAGDIDTVRELYAAADSALYVAKTSGRNRVHVAGTPVALYSEDLIWAETSAPAGASAAA